MVIAVGKILIHRWEKASLYKRQKKGRAPEGTRPESAKNNVRLKIHLGAQERPVE